MSIFDAVKGLMDNDAVKELVTKECGDNPLVSHAVDMVNSPEVGGVQGLMQQFHANGLGEIVNSWVGQGGNQPISADQIQQVLGSDKISAIAEKFGISPDDASAKLAQVLPSIVDKMTPGGEVPQS
jgi:uncharacterized protein YidB (DUF937 family)